MKRDYSEIDEIVFRKEKSIHSIIIIFSTGIITYFNIGHWVVWILFSLTILVQNANRPKKTIIKIKGNWIEEDLQKMKTNSYSKTNSKSDSKMEKKE